MAFCYLAHINPKRRRIAKLSPLKAQSARAKFVWLIVALPGALLLWLGETSAFVSWLGAITLAGWLAVTLIFPQIISESD